MGGIDSDEIAELFLKRYRFNNVDFISFKKMAFAARKKAHSEKIRTLIYSSIRSGKTDEEILKTLFLEKYRYNDIEKQSRDADETFAAMKKAYSEKIRALIDSLIGSGKKCEEIRKAMDGFFELHKPGTDLDKIYIEGIDGFIAHVKEKTLGPNTYGSFVRSGRSK